MVVQIKLSSYLKTMLGFRIKDFEITEPIKLRELINVKLSDDRIMVLVNDIGASMDTIIKDGDKILISPIFGGGS